MAFNTILTKARILFIAPLGTKQLNINSRIVHLDNKYLYFDLNANDIYFHGPISVT